MRDVRLGVELLGATYAHLDRLEYRRQACSGVESTPPVYSAWTQMLHQRRLSLASSALPAIHTSQTSATKGLSEANIQLATANFMRLVFKSARDTLGGPLEPIPRR